MHSCRNHSIYGLARGIGANALVPTCILARSLLSRRILYHPSPHRIFPLTLNMQLVDIAGSLQKISSALGMIRTTDYKHDYPQKMIRLTGSPYATCPDGISAPYSVSPKPQMFRCDHSLKIEVQEYDLRFPAAATICSSTETPGNRTRTRSVVDSWGSI